MTASEQPTQKEQQQRLPHVIAITSGKGGVGKSSIAVNLAIALAKAGRRVCIFDADTGLANVNILLGLKPEYSLEHVLFGAKSIEDIMLAGPHNLKVIPGAHGISECVNLHPRQQMRLTRELSRIEADFDYLLVDTAAGIADTTLDFISAAQQALVVVTPEPTSLTDAFSLIKLLQRRGGAVRYRVVVNMCNSIRQAKEIFHRFQAAVERYIGVELEYLGFILRDESLRASVSLQNPVALFPDSDPSARGFIRLGESLEQSLDGSRPARSFSSYWHQRFHGKSEADLGKDEATKPDLKANQQPAWQDSDYLAELASRFTLLIEQQRVDADTMARVFSEMHDEYWRHFGRPALDPLTLVERLTGSTNRNDDLLRALYQKVKPWQPDSPPREAPNPAPAIHGEPDPVAAPAEVSVVDAAATPGTSAQPAAAPQPAPGQPRYNDRRYGSQDTLVELLRRQGDSGRTVADLIASLA